MSCAMCVDWTQTTKLIMHADGIVSARACFCFDLTEYANIHHEGQTLFSSRDTRVKCQDVVFAGRYCWVRVRACTCGGRSGTRLHQLVRVWNIFMPIRLRHDARTTRGVTARNFPGS